MNKTCIPVILLSASIIFLGMYALDVFDGENVIKSVYESGGFTYSGGLKDGLFYGYGEIDFDDGYYYGGFVNGRFEGEGYLKINGWDFQGLFENGQANMGTFDGTIIYNRDSHTLKSQNWLYEGEFNEYGQKNNGTFIFPDGSAYTGEFYHGLADGEGTYIDPLGNIIYIGEFYEGLFDGYGTYYSPENWVYEGEFYEGLFDGEGVIFFNDTLIRGLWVRGEQIEYYGQD